MEISLIKTRSMSTYSNTLASSHTVAVLAISYPAAPSFLQSIMSDEVDPHSVVQLHGAGVCLSKLPDNISKLKEFAADLMIHEHPKNRYCFPKPRNKDLGRASQGAVRLLSVLFTGQNQIG